MDVSTERCQNDIKLLVVLSVCALHGPLHSKIYIYLSTLLSLYPAALFISFRNSCFINLYPPIKYVKWNKKINTDSFCSLLEENNLRLLKK